MRADRLIQLLLLLQSRAQVTANEAADALGVSVATARRDLEALAAAGVPVYASPGRGGGWALVGGSRTNLTGVTQPEADALVALLGSVPGNSALRGAVRKLVRALPETFRADAERLSAAVLADGAGWGDVESTEPEILTELRTLLARRQRIEIDYTDGRGTRLVRAFDPWGLVDKAGTWYLVTGAQRDGSGGARRVLRVDRIASLRSIGPRTEPPEGFDLEREWQRFVARAEDMRASLSATVVIAESAVGPFVGLLGRNVTLRDDVLVPGRRTATVTSTSVEMLARQVAGWSGLVEVLDPPAVRAELVRMGAELAATHNVASSVSSA